ncbi:MAG: T9SS type A sorting domain-containing protein [Lewinellaceae bacterium]|nr:T9SS type A sorting domain-containing protein [Lewinellaceae bacterium]
MLNKYLFAALALLFAGAVVAQSHSPKPLLKSPNLPTKHFSKTIIPAESFVPDIETPNLLSKQSAGNRGPEEIVGSTYWDAQSYGAMSSRIYANAQGEPVAHWLYSAQSTGYSDRGTAQNVRAGGTWGGVTGREEANRTGFPAAAMLGDGSEIIISHNTGTTPWAIWMAKKAPGSSTWTETALPGPPGGIRMLWPKIAIGGTDNMTIHIIAITAPVGGATFGSIYDGLDGHLLYYRSTDGGSTWDKQYVKIPGIDDSQYDGFSADSYTIDASGNTVAVGVFLAYDWNDMLIYKSTDNGENWSDMIMRDFPDALEGYTPQPGLEYTIDDITEIDTLAPEALAVMTNDGFGSVLIDQNGQVHVWFGRMYVIDNDFTDSSSFIYPGMNGILYWKESWGANNLQIITGAFDYDNNGSIIMSNDQIAPYGGANISSFPVTGIDADGTLYLCYSAVNEQFISADNFDFFRHLYLMKSTSNGEDWGDALELTAAPYVEVEIAPFVECVWPSMPRNIGDKVWVLYQQDYTPGTNVWGAHHDPLENTMNWVEVDPDDLPVGAHEVPKPSPSLALNLSPNPASETSVLSATLSGESDVSVEIFDLLGNRVFQQSVPSVAGRQYFPLPVQNLHTGSYWVRITEGKQFGITKLVVAK